MDPGMPARSVKPMVLGHKKNFDGAFYQSIRGKSRKKDHFRSIFDKITGLAASFILLP
jgi:hypothetical protein